MGQLTASTNNLSNITMKQHSLAQSVTKQLTVPVVLSAIVFAVSYLSILIYAPNYRLLETLAQNNYPLSVKMSLIWNLFLGGLITQSFFGVTLLLIIASLIGMNLALFLKSYQTVKKNGKAHFAVGGSMVLGFMSTSCAVMCGFSLLPLLGTTLGASFSAIDGIAFRIITISLLSVSLWYTLNSSRDNRSWISTKS